MSSSVHPPTGRGVPRLTAQESAALTAAAAGFSQAAAARRFGLGFSYYKSVLCAAAGRLGAVSTVHAVAVALLDDQLDREAIRDRQVPAWPGDRGHAATLARFEAARAARKAAAAERRNRLGALLAQRVPLEAAAIRIGVSMKTAQRYVAQLEAEAVERGAGG